MYDTRSVDCCYSLINCIYFWVEIISTFRNKLAFNNPFVIITNQWDLNSRRSNQNPVERISITIPDWFKINRTYFRASIFTHQTCMPLKIVVNILFQVNGVFAKDLQPLLSEAYSKQECIL